MNRVLAAFAVGLVALALSGSAMAQGAQAPAGVTFDQYRARTMAAVQAAQTQMANRLSQSNLSADERQQLQQRKTRIDRFAAMPLDQQTQLLRKRFDRIDTNHDGVVDQQELAAFRAAQQRGGAGAGGGGDPLAGLTQ